MRLRTRCYEARVWRVCDQRWRDFTPFKFCDYINSFPRLSDFTDCGVKHSKYSIKLTTKLGERELADSNQNQNQNQKAKWRSENQNVKNKNGKGENENRNLDRKAKDEVKIKTFKTKNWKIKNKNGNVKNKNRKVKKRKDEITIWPPRLPYDFMYCVSEPLHCEDWSREMPTLCKTN